MDFEFDDLKREFLEEAEGKIGEVRTNLEIFPPTAEKLERMIYLAHQLKGAGGSYGFQVISTDSAELEHDLERLKAGGGEELATTLRERVEKIAAVIAERATELAQK